MKILLYILLFITTAFIIKTLYTDYVNDKAWNRCFKMAQAEKIFDRGLEYYYKSNYREMGCSQIIKN